MMYIIKKEKLKMKKVNYFVIIAVISIFMNASATMFAAPAKGSFDADTTIKPKPEEKSEDQNLSEEQRTLNRLRSEKSALAEYEAQQARLEAELEKRRAQEAQKIRMARDQSPEPFGEVRVPAERSKNEQELERKKAELERKIKELEERKAVMRERKAQLEIQKEKNKFNPKPLDGEEIMKAPQKEHKEPYAKTVIEEVSDAELERLMTESEERRMNPILLKLTASEDFFIKDGYDLTPDAKDEIRKYASQIKKLEYQKITVEGHTDSFETLLQAKKSSRLRAKSVYDELIRNGVPADKMQYVGLADKIREESNKTKKGRFANRRTEIFVE